MVLLPILLLAAAVASAETEPKKPCETPDRPAGHKSPSPQRSEGAQAQEDPNCDAGAVTQVINRRKLELLPLGDRRAMAVAAIGGAAVFVGYDSGHKASFSLAGGRAQSQSFLVDGGNGQTIRMAGGEMDFDTPVESLAELKLISAGYSAEYGGSSAGVVSARLRGGSNRLRGSVFDFLRNDALDAPNFFAPVSGKEKLKPPLRYNVFGGTLGGPLRRDRTYFFASYEGSRRREGSSRVLTVPTLLQRDGDFSGTWNTQGKLVTVFDPASGRPRTPFPGNRIPTSRFDPVAARLVPLYPTPNAEPGPTGSNNFSANSGRTFLRDHVTAKADHALTSKDHLSVRYIHDRNDQTTRSIFPEPAAENQPDTLSSQHNAFASWTRTIRATLTFDTRLTWSHRSTLQVSQGLDAGWPSRLGLSGVSDRAFPRFAASGYSPLGAANQERLQDPSTQTQWLAALKWQRGPQSWSIGAEFRPSRNLEIDNQTVSGSFIFSPLATAQPGQTGGGNSFASLLLGLPNSFSTRQTLPLERASRYIAVFAQGSFRARPNLLVSTGLRWEADTAIRDLNGRINGFDTQAINPVSGTPGVVTFGAAEPYRTDWNNFGPRIGFAWRTPRGQAIVRGGYGVFFSHPFDRGVTAAASLGYEISARLVSPDNGITAPFVLASGVPVSPAPPLLDAAFGAAAPGAAPSTAVTFFESGRRTGYAHQYNLGIQRTFDGTLIEVSGIGNLGRKLPSGNLTINQIRPEFLGPSATQALRPFPQFSDVSIVAPALGVSSYHAALIRIEKRFSRDLQFLSTYTWAKFMNNVDEGSGGGLGADTSYSNFYDRRADWGPSANDIRHRFTWGGVYDLPFPGRVFSGWSVGSVVTLQSAAPFTVTTQANTTGAFSAGPLRADVLYDPNLAGGLRTVAQWFDTAAFTQPAPFQFGNQGVNVLRGDSLLNFDFSLVRTFRFGERFGLQLRGEVFNAGNHPNFGAPGSVLGNPDFGVVDSAGPARRFQIALRVTF